MNRMMLTTCCCALVAARSFATFAAAGVPADSPLRRAPQVVDVPVDRLPEAELLGTPEVRTLLGYTRRVLHLHDGHTLALFSFSNAAEANWLFLIDARDLSVERYDIPNNDIASHGAALGSDGNLYIMPYGNGRAYRFDVEGRKFDPIKVDLPTSNYTWHAFGASNGRIYFGTYPHAYLGEYDIKAGTCKLIRQAVPDKKYTVQFSEETDGRIRFKGMGPGDAWMLYDPESGTLESAEPPAPAADAKLSLPQPDVPDKDQRFARRITVGDRRFAISFPSSRFWEIDADGKLMLRGDPKAPAEVWFLETLADTVVGISHFGVAFRYDVGSGAFQRKQLPNRAPAGNGIMFIEAITPRCVIGANYSQQNLFKIDPQTGNIDVADHMVARVTGEPMCAVGFGGKAYVGIYVSSLISVYDPDQPFAFGKNPRELIELGKRYKQTRPRAAVTDGRLVFISSDSAYSELGGALAVVDPETDKIDVYHHLIKDQNLPTLAYDPKTKVLWGGTDRWGQMRSHPPTQEHSLIYAFDPKSRKVVAKLMPWKGADVTNLIGVCNGVLMAGNADEITLIDTATREVLYKGTSPMGVPRRIVVGRDGYGYWLSGGTLHRWNPKKNTMTPVARTPGCGFLTEPSPGTWCVANSKSVYRVRPSRR